MTTEVEVTKNYSVGVVSLVWDVDNECYVLDTDGGSVGMCPDSLMGLKAIMDKWSEDQ